MQICHRSGRLYLTALLFIFNSHLLAATLRREWMGPSNSCFFFRFFSTFHTGSLLTSSEKSRDIVVTCLVSWFTEILVSSSHQWKWDDSRSRVCPISSVQHLRCAKATNPLVPVNFTRATFIVFCHKDFSSIPVHIVVFSCSDQRWRTCSAFCFVAQAHFPSHILFYCSFSTCWKPSLFPRCTFNCTTYIEFHKWHYVFDLVPFCLLLDGPVFVSVSITWPLRKIAESSWPTLVCWKEP